MTSDDIQKKLLEPFDPFDIEWRVQRSGVTNGKRWAMVLAYVTNRAIMERLDEVFGVGGWQNEYIQLADGGFICGIKAKFDDEWVVKYDGASKTDIEATKGGLSSAMKRAGVQWGIGRYLYRLDTTFVTLLDKDQKHQTGDYLTALVKVNKEDKYPAKFFYERPNLPKFALPGAEE
jgi:hypothetical protein